MAQVSLHNVRKVFPGRAGAVEAVRDLTLDVADGEFVVLVGPSGCGKTTTLRMVAGLDEPTGGQISIGGRIVNNVHPKDRDIAMVFQNYALYPHMRVDENMAFALKLRRLPRVEIDRRVQAAARILGIEDLLHRKPGQLSGGQRQRVAVGRAIVREPKAFLFDEPLSNLDAKLRVTTRAELKALHQRLKTTTIYVTHDQEEAMTLGDRIAVMSRGLIQQVGPPLQVYTRPANRFVASFVGTPPMNFISGRVRPGPDALEFVEYRQGQDGWTLPLPAAAKGIASRLGEAQVVLGLRPQAFREAPSGSLHLRVGIVEPLGESIDLLGEITPPGAGTPLVVRLPARSGIRAGDIIHLEPDPHRLHLFEPGEFGASLWP
jgi:multiple sugar transport system ATP-binding protein